MRTYPRTRRAVSPLELPLARQTLKEMKFSGRPVLEYQPLAEVLAMPESRRYCSPKIQVLDYLEIDDQCATPGVIEQMAG
jgi:hypothetical protein